MSAGAPRKGVEPCARRCFRTRSFQSIWVDHGVEAAVKKGDLDGVSAWQSFVVFGLGDEMHAHGGIVLVRKHVATGLCFEEIVEQFEDGSPVFDDHEDVAAAALKERSQGIDIGAH